MDESSGQLVGPKITHNRIMAYIRKINPDYVYNIDDFVCLEFNDPNENCLREWNLDLTKPTKEDIGKITEEEITNFCEKMQKTTCQRFEEIEKRLDLLEKAHKLSEGK